MDVSRLTSTLEPCTCVPTKQQMTVVGTVPGMVMFLFRRLYYCSSYYYNSPLWNEMTKICCGQRPLALGPILYI